MRPNALAMDSIKRMRLDPSMHKTHHLGEEQAGRAIPYPLPRGTISMHVRCAVMLLHVRRRASLDGFRSQCCCSTRTDVQFSNSWQVAATVIGQFRCLRHGDKGREMKLVPFQEYVEAAEKLINQNPLNYKRVGFVSTEDQAVIDDAAKLTRIDTGIGLRHQRAHMLPICCWRETRGCRGGVFLKSGKPCHEESRVEMAARHLLLSAVCMVRHMHMLGKQTFDTPYALCLAVQAQVQTPAGWCIRQGSSGRTAVPCSSCPKPQAKRR